MAHTITGSAKSAPGDPSYPQASSYYASLSWTTNAIPIRGLRQSQSPWTVASMLYDWVDWWNDRSIWTLWITGSLAGSTLSLQANWVFEWSISYISYITWMENCFLEEEGTTCFDVSSVRGSIWDMIGIIIIIIILLCYVYKFRISAYRSISLHILLRRIFFLKALRECCQMQPLSFNLRIWLRSSSVLF